MALPKMDKSLDFAQLLRNELPINFPIASSTLTAEQQRQLTEAQERLLSGIVTTHDERTRSSLFSTSLNIIEGFIISIRVRSAVLMLGVAYLVFHIVDDRLYKNLYGCVSKEEYFLRTSLLPIFGPTTLHNLYWEGYALEMFQFQLLSGSFGIPAFTFEFIAANRTKLLDFPAAVQQFDPHAAVLHFRDDSSREFTTWVKNGVPTQALNAEGSNAQDAPEPSPEAEERKAQAKARAEARKLKAAERQAAIDAEVATFSKDDTFVVRCFQAGLVPYIATAPDGHPEFLDTIAERLVAFRERQNRKTAEDLINEDFDPANPVDLTDGPGRLSNIFDIEARIRAANASVVEGKRITFILFYRLYNEDALVTQWQALGYTSFQKYTEDHLGVGSEAYEFAKIGFALIKFRHFIAELPNRDSEDLFPKLPYIEAALVTYKGDYLAIRHALITLSPADFKDFALNADFVERQFAKPVTAAQLDEVYSFRSMLTHNRLYGHGAAMKLVAVLDQDESRVVHWIFAEMKAELAAAQTPAPVVDEPSTSPATDEPTTDDDGAQEERQTINETA